MRTMRRDVAAIERLFNSQAEPETATAYLLAAALVSDLRQRHGTAVPGAIVDRVARGVGFAEAFTLETGETPDEAAARAWQIYRRWTSWIPTVTSSFTLWIGILLLAVAAFLATAAQTMAAPAAVGSRRISGRRTRRYSRAFASARLRLASLARVLTGRASSATSRVR